MTDPVAEFKNDMSSKIFGGFLVLMLNAGEELGIFKASIDKGPMTSDALAAVAGINARYCKEFCIMMASNGIFVYNEASNTFEVRAEIIPALQDEATLALSHSMIAVIQKPERLIAAMKDGKAISWGEQHHYLCSGARRFFGPIYENHLISNLPDVVIEPLKTGCKVIDFGCGEGVSCCVIGKEFPLATIHGIDKDGPSIESATKRAVTKGLSNVTFSAGSAADAVKNNDYTIAFFLDCFHDMAVARQAAKTAFDSLKPGGYTVIVEPMAAENDSIAEQLACATCTPYSAFSCTICLPCGMEDGGDALGTLCPTSKHREIFVAAGFSKLESIECGLNGLGFRLMLAHKDK